MSACSPATSALRSAPASAHSSISAPKVKYGTRLRAGADAMCLTSAQITSTGTGRNASACANGLRCVRLATSGTKSLVPAFALLKSVRLATIGTTNSASACVCQSHAQTQIKSGTRLVASASATFLKSAPTTSTGTTDCVYACARRSKFAAHFTIGIRKTASAFAKKYLRAVLLELSGTPTLANVTDANKKSAQVYLSGNSPLASAYAHTPPPQLLQSPLNFLVQHLNSTKNAANASTAMPTAIGTAIPALATAN